MAKANKSKKSVAVVESVFDVEAICSSDLSLLCEEILASCQSAAEEKAVSFVIGRIETTQKKVLDLYDMLRDRLPKTEVKILKLRKISETSGERLAAKKAKLVKLQAEIAALEAND